MKQIIYKYETDANKIKNRCVLCRRKITDEEGALIV